MCGQGELSGVSHYRPEEAKSLHCLLRLARPGASADSPISASNSGSAVISDAQRRKGGWKGLDRGSGCAASSYPLIFSSLPVIESSLKSGPHTDPLDKPSDKRGLWVAAQDLNFSVHSIVNFPSTQGCLSQTSSYVCTKVNMSATCLSATRMETSLTTHPSFKLRECCDRLMKWPMSRRVEETPRQQRKLQNCVDSGAHPVLHDFKHVYGLTSETIVVAETVSLQGKINSFTFHTHKVKYLGGLGLALGLDV